MKQEKGITLVALVITVLVMSILAGTAISSGRSIIDSNKVMAFIQELKIVQSEVNVIVEKQKQGDTSYDAIGIEVSRLDTETMTKLVKGPLKGKTAEEIIDFKYYRVSDLQQMGIENVNQPVLINLKTREVISVNGIEDAGKMCYKLEDFPSESYNVQELKMIETILKEGDYIWYEDAKGTKQKCVVLYGPENEKYNSYGIQIITTSGVETIMFGSSDANKAKEDYNNVIATLNSKAEEYRKKADGIATKARCVGSVPDNPSYDGPGYYHTGITDSQGVQIKEGDNNYEADVEQLDLLRIDVSSAWLASRRFLDTNGYIQCALRTKQGMGGAFHQPIYVFQGDFDLSEKGMQLNSRPIFPVFILNPKATITGGSGTVDDPYTLGA